METETNNISRRNFIRLSGMTGAALTVGFYFPVAGKDAEVVKMETAENLGIELNAWITIDNLEKLPSPTIAPKWGKGLFNRCPR